MEWIDIKNREPEHLQQVLITDGDVIATAIVDLKSYDKIEWRFFGISGYECEWDFIVTHWMPLPEPPKLLK